MKSKSTITIGVLALQGDFEAHVKMLSMLENVNAIAVRSAKEIESVDGLILPGGESTTVGKLLRRFELDTLIKDRAGQDMPIYGTCAGMILLAKDIEDSSQDRLGILDVEVARNAFGRQVDSFEADIDVLTLGELPIRGVFIRAPYVKTVGPNVEILAQYGGRIVAVRQKNVLASAFHPELTTDTRFHQLFAEVVRQSQ